MNRNFAINRIHIIFFFLFCVISLIIIRLFYLQVIAHSTYLEIAQAEQYGYTKLPARRGEILTEDYHSGESFKLATNTTLNMIYADPTLIENPGLVAETLAPLLFDLELEEELDIKTYSETEKMIMAIEDFNIQQEALSELSYKSDEELFESYEESLESIFATKTRDVILIAEDLDEETKTKILAKNIEGTELTESGNFYAYPDKISDKSGVAKDLADIFNTESDDLERILLGKNRFVVLKRKLEQEISEQIESILNEDRVSEDPQFLGIRLNEEYFRFYPEQELAAQVLGYVNSAGTGQYGVEGSFNDIISGQDGIFTSQIDAYGNQITVGESVIEAAVDGANVTLTIDRAIQRVVEEELAAGVEEYRADSGEVIVINPATGAVLAMAQYPSYNPNVYGDAFELEEIILSQTDKDNLYETGTEEDPRFWLYIQTNPDIRIELFQDEEDPESYYKYVNTVGPEVYKNKSTQEFYEPGSIFKPIVMSAAINSGEVGPNTTFVDSGPIEVDFNTRTGMYDFTIDNFDGQHHGLQTMTQVLEKSNNIGMAFVAQLLGPSLFYTYLEDFGFTKRTSLGLSNEITGSLSHYSGWTESELITKAFGQGIAVTPIQLVQAYSALANEGSMMQPYLVKEIEYASGELTVTEPKIVRQVITDESSQSITAMMTASMESYYYLTLDQHYIAGKSGTAQTYNSAGEALSGIGTTIASFVGFGPIHDPKFLVLVKLDYPRTVQWGSATAGPIFKDIASFLFDYYNIPPDRA